MKKTTWTNPGPVGRFCPRCERPVLAGIVKRTTSDDVPASQAVWVVTCATCGARVRTIKHKDTEK